MTGTSQKKFPPLSLPSGLAKLRCIYGYIWMMKYEVQSKKDKSDVQGNQKTMNIYRNSIDK
jgi:hypothetical protein